MTRRDIAWGLKVGALIGLVYGLFIITGVPR
jgi:hypothetical protein